MLTGAAAHGSGAGDSRSVYLLKIAAIAGAYYGAAKLGLDLAFTTESVTAIWAPTRIALAAVVLWGYRVLPGVALGAFLANVWTDVPLYTVLDHGRQHARGGGGRLPAAAGGQVPAVAGAGPGRRRAGGPRRCGQHHRQRHDRRRQPLLAGGEIDSGDLASVWRTWWLGDMGGDLVVAPALLVAATHWPYDRAPGRRLEALGLAP